MSAKGKEKKGNKKRDSSKFDTFIYKILMQVHPDSGLKGSAKTMLDQICKLLVNKFMKTANELCAGKNVKTLSNRILQAAVRMTLPAELATHAVSEATKRLTYYNSAKGEGRSTRADKAGLQISVSRIEHLMRKNTVVERMGETASVYMAAVVEYLLAEILETAGNFARDHKRIRIIPRDIKLAISKDSELEQVFCHTVLGSGVAPYIDPRIVKNNATTQNWFE